MISAKKRNKGKPSTEQLPLNEQLALSVLAGIKMRATKFDLKHAESIPLVRSKVPTGRDAGELVYLTEKRRVMMFDGLCWSVYCQLLPDEHAN